MKIGCYSRSTIFAPPTFINLGDVVGISESYANKRYHEYRDILVKVLHLPGHKALLDDTWMAVILDVTEQPIERPGKQPRQWYSGKKKRHTGKIQLIICLSTLQILSVVCGKGRTHDFTLFKQCGLHLAEVLENMRTLAIKVWTSSSRMPLPRSRN